MGRFAFIKDFSARCPKCKEEIFHFQSKDNVDFDECAIDEVSHFYSKCPTCDAWIDFIRKIPPLDGMTTEEYAERYFDVECIRPRR